MGHTGGTDEDWMDLADAITLLRGQIAQAQTRLAAAGDRGVVFGLGEITLELGVELARTRGGDGSLRFGVVGLGTKGERARKATHTVTVSLTARRPDGRPVNVADEE